MEHSRVLDKIKKLQAPDRLVRIIKLQAQAICLLIEDDSECDWDQILQLSKNIEANADGYFRRNT